MTPRVSGDPTAKPCVHSVLAVPLVSPFYLLTIRREGVPPVSSRAEIRKAVVRYGLYVNSRKWIDGIFNELDKDKSGDITSLELAHSIMKYRYTPGM